MAYKKQNFVDGQVLEAEHLNHIETGIVDLENLLNSPNQSKPVTSVNDIKPDENGNVELSGYAKTEDIPTKPEDIGAQPAGNYLTEVPDGYALKNEIPTKNSQLQNDSGFLTGYTETDPTVPAWAKQPNKPTYTADEVGAQPKGNYLTEVPADYATKQFVTDKIAEAELGGEEVDLSGYAQKSELPTKVSQLQNDKGYLTEHQDISGKLDADKLQEAVNEALAQAKASGEFDGAPGEPGPQGPAYTLTDTDKATIVTSVIEELPVYNGEVVEV